MTYFEAIWKILKIFLIVMWLIVSIGIGCTGCEGLDECKNQATSRWKYIVEIIFGLISAICCFGFIVYILQ
jgi:hypothetical protein